jgi:transposase
MALGRRKERQTELFIPTAQLRPGPGHPFYTKLNAVLAEAGFDALTEKLCAPYYKDGDRPGIPPGVYFRMLFIGYFEGIDSQRGIAWRCADSLALRAILGLPLTDATPVHASLSVIRQRLPEDVFDRVFQFVLGLLEERGLLKGQTLGIDATTLEANAAMKSIVRKDTGADWKTYLRTLAQAEGMEKPSAADLQRLDRGRKDKKVSNDQWESPSDPDARIARMKDGTAHLAYKAEHAVDLQTEAIVAATVTPADRGDGSSGAETLVVAQWNLHQSGSAATVRELAADKGYHDRRLLAWSARWQVRTYMPERKQKRWRWTDKPAEYEAAFRGNRRRMRGEKGRRLSRWRSEKCERTFAHVCETGGGRLSWLRGLSNVTKAHVLKCAAYNLGLLLRKVFGLAKPRSGPAGFELLFHWLTALAHALHTLACGRRIGGRPGEPIFWRLVPSAQSGNQPPFLTG